MTPGHQLNLWANQAAKGPEILGIIEDGIWKEAGVKEFAFLVGRSPDQIRQACHGQDKYFSVTWIPLFLQSCPVHGRKLINLLCDYSLPKLEHPEERRTLTLEEENERLREQIRRFRAAAGVSD